MRIRVLFAILLVSLSVYAVRFSEEAKCNCQMMDSIHGTVTLIFATDSAHFAFPLDSIIYISAYGSISEWGEKKDGYQLDSISEDSCFYHTFTYQQLERPGNSGQPEFMFYVETIDSAYYLLPDTIGENAIDRRMVFVNNEMTLLLFLPNSQPYFTTDTNELYARCLEAQEVRPLSDYDLTDSVDQHRICNFRRVPGTMQLYRSYHPYYPDKPQYDTEVVRLHWVAELAQQVGIRSDITLSSNQEKYVGTKYACQGDSVIISMPLYHQQLLADSNILYVGEQYGGHPSVGACFYHSESLQYAQWMQEVVEFIMDNNHPLPIQMHCALGADRTGMFSATIAAMCGADWQTIVADYCETSNMKIQTYRHPNRLYYAFERMIGAKPDQLTTSQLCNAVRQHFVDMGVLTLEQIQAMVNRLNQPVVTDVDRVEYNRQSVSSYDLLGRLVDASYKGIVIQQGVKVNRYD